MTKHNEYGAELFLSAMERYQSGTSNIRTALRDAAKGYGEMYRHIVASNDGVEPKGPAMAAKLKAILTSRGPTGNNVTSWIDDRHHRMALLWMDQNFDKVAWVFSNSEASTPLTVYNAWKAYFRKTIKAGWDESEKGDAVEPKDFLGVAFPGVTLDEVEAEWTRLVELKAKREEEKPAPEPEPTADITTVIASMDVMALAEAVARRPDAKAIADGLYQLFARLEVKPQPQHLGSVGAVVEALSADVSSFALMRGNSTKVAARIRVNRKFSKVTIHVGDDATAHERSFKGRTMSVKLLKTLIMDTMIEVGDYPPEGGTDQIGPNTGPANFTLAFRLFREA